VPVLLEMGHRTFGRVDRDVGEVWAAQSLQLGVQIGEVAALQQRIVREVDARRHVLGHERHLLGLGEEVVDHPVQHQPPDDPDRNLLLRDDLGGVQDVEGELFGERFVKQLDAQFPFGKIALRDRVPQVTPVKVGIGAVDFHRLVPGHRLQAQLGLPVELHEG